MRKPPVHVITLSILLLLAAGAARAQSSETPETPGLVEFRFYFQHLAALDAAADKADAEGTPGADTDGWRRYEQNAAGLNDREAAILKDVAYRCNQAIRDRKSAPEPRPRTLEILSAAVEELRTHLAPEAFESLARRIKGFIRPGIVEVPAAQASGAEEDELPVEPQAVTEVVQVGSLTGMFQDGFFFAQCFTALQGAITDQSYIAGVSSCFLHGTGLPPIPLGCVGRDGLCMQTFPPAPPGHQRWTQAGHFLQMYHSANCLGTGAPGLQDPLRYCGRNPLPSIVDFADIPPLGGTPACWGGYPQTDLCSLAVSRAFPVTYLDISPRQATVHAGGELQFATLNNMLATWSVNGPGTINDFGLYKAPSSVDSQQTATITACDAYAPGYCVNATITLTPLKVAVVARDFEVLPDGETILTATVTPAAPGQELQWTLSPAVGTLTASGNSATYKAPKNDDLPGAFEITVKACLKPAGTVCGTANVLVPRIQFFFNLSENKDTLALDERIQLTAVVHGPVVPRNLTWEASEGELIELSPADNYARIYQAPSFPMPTDEGAIIIVKACIENTEHCATQPFAVPRQLQFDNITSDSGKWQAGTKTFFTITGKGFVNPTPTVALLPLGVTVTLVSPTSIRGWVILPASAAPAHIEPIVAKEHPNGVIELIPGTRITPEPAALAVTPPAAELRAGQSLLLTAVCKTSSALPCTSGEIPVWTALVGTVSPAAGGSVIYTAPATVTNGTVDTVKVCWNANGCAFAPVTLLPAEPCPKSLSPSGFTATATGGRSQLIVNADASCPWTATVAGDLQQFIHLIDANGNRVASISGTGTKVIQFEVDPNTKDKPQAGSIEVKGGTVLSFSINQTTDAAPPNCPKEVSTPFGTTGLLVETQNLVLNATTDTPLDARYAWYSSDDPGHVLSTSPQLMLVFDDADYPKPGQGATVDKYYYATVSSESNPKCPELRSDYAQVTFDGTSVGEPSTITGPEPVNYVFSSGGTATLSVNAQVFEGVIVEYQWYYGFTPDTSSPIGGATSSSITVGPGEYWCAVKTIARRRSFTYYSGTGRVIHFSPPSEGSRIVRHDFNYDGRSDLVWRNKATGAIRAWTMNGLQHLSTMNLGVASTALELQSVGDLNGDSRPDLIFRNPESGENSVRLMQGSFASPQPLALQPDPSWYIGACADMDDDGAEDLIWYNTATAEVRIWYMAGTAHVGSWNIGYTDSTDWRLQGTGDYNVDGKPDLVFRNFTTGENVVWLMDDNVVIAQAPLPAFADTNWRIASTDDSTGEGYADLWWFNAATGETQFWQMAQISRGTVSAGETENDLNWEIVGVGTGAPEPKVVVPTTLAVSAPPSPRNGVATLTAILTTPDGPLAGQSVTFTLDGALIGSATTSTAGQASVSVSLAGVAVGTHAIGAAFAGDEDYAAASATSSLEVTKATPLLVWNTPAPIVYGTPLSSLQLNATADVPGTFTYDVPAGTLLNAGTHTLHATFTPADVTSYATATTTTTLIVQKAVPVITWPTPAMITYGTPLSATQLNATANVAGTFTYTPALATVLPAGQHTLTASFTPSDGELYRSTTATTTLTVTKAAPIITWPAPAAIVYGTALSDMQLNATANVAGTFTYTPALATVLPAGQHTLTASFTPSDGELYASTTATTTLTVTKAVPIITWPAPAAIVYGTALSDMQLNATANVAGTFAYTPAAGTVLPAGARTLSADFTPADAANYTTAIATTALVVQKAKPVITWHSPAAIIYGAPLSATQHNATANVSGTFTYTPTLATVLPAGLHTLTASFAPSDGENYVSTTATTTLTVEKATPIITWPTPAAIVYGTALSDMQLNATANVAGTFAYTPAAGTVLPAGARTLSADFTPADAANYTAAIATTALVVQKAKPVITWHSPAAIIYGAPLSATQHNATANVSGTFTYTPTLATVLPAGLHTLTASFTPSDGENYVSTTANTTLTVEKATPIITWPTPAAIVYGTALSDVQLNATANVAGTFAYTPAVGAVLPAGTRTLSADFTPADAANYMSATATTALVVQKAKPVITWHSPATINYGTPLSALQLNATANVAGAFTYTPAAGAVLNAGTRTLSVHFTPTDGNNYEEAGAEVLLSIAKAPLTVTPANATKTYGDAVPPLAGTITGIVNKDPISATYSTTATASSIPGTYPITATLVDQKGRLQNYEVTLNSGMLTITRAPLTIRVNDSAKQYSDPLPPFTVTFQGFVLGETPAVLPGTLMFSTAATQLGGPGLYAVIATGLGSSNYSLTYLPGTLAVVAEDARLAYDGSRLVAAGAAVTTVFSATVSDISVTSEANGDDAPGDLVRATVTFVDRSSGTVLCVAPVILLDAVDPRSGVANCRASLDLAGRTSILIGSIVGGWYARDSRADDVTLSVAAPSDAFLTGGGQVVVAQSTGSLAVDAGARLQVNAQTAGKNPSLKVEFTHAGHVYRFTATSLLNVAIVPARSGGAAEVLALAKLEDITNPDAPFIIETNALLRVAIDDDGEPGRDDTLAVAAWKSQGGLWLAMRTQALDKGNFQVHEH